MKPGLIKDFYNSISWLVDGISKFNGAAVAFGALAGAITLFASTAAKAGGILAATRAAFMNHPIFMAATIAVGVVAAFGAISNAIDSSTEKMEEAKARKKRPEGRFNLLNSEKITDVLKNINYSNNSIQIIPDKDDKVSKKLKDDYGYTDDQIEFVEDESVLVCDLLSVIHHFNHLFPHPLNWNGFGCRNGVNQGVRISQT